MSNDTDVTERAFLVSRHAAVVTGAVTDHDDSSEIGAEYEDAAVADYFRDVPLRKWKYKGKGVFEIAIFVCEEGSDVVNRYTLTATIDTDSGVPVDGDELADAVVESMEAIDDEEGAIDE